MIQSDRRTLLVIRGGALGDVLLTIPVLRFLRDSFPDAVLLLAARMPVANLLKDCKIVDDIVDLDGNGLLFLYSNKGKGNKLPSFLRPVFKVISFVSDSDGIMAKNLKEAGIIDFQVIPPPLGETHAVIHFLRQVGCDISDISKINMSLQLPQECINRGLKIRNKIGDRICVIHAGSGSIRKNWPLTNFVRLADIILNNFGIQPIFTIGEADSRILDKIKNMQIVHPYVSDLSLQELAGLINASEFYIGNDSGVTHLAALIGTQVIALFGPTDPKVWGPVGTNVVMIKAMNTGKEDFGLIEMEKIVSAINSFIKN